MDKKLSQLLHPKYWPSWLAAGFLFVLVNILPQSLRLQLGRFISKLLPRFLTYRLTVAKTNIEHCFSENQAKQIFSAHQSALGRGLIEMSMGWFLPKYRFNGLSTHEGIEHVEKALAEKRGVILLSMHTTCLDLTSPFITQNFQALGMYRPLKNPVFDLLIYKARARYAIAMITQGDIRSMLKYLEDGQIVWYAADQDFGRKAKSVFAPFFGEQAYTLPLYRKLAERTNAAVIPMSIVYDHELKKYRTRYFAEIPAEQFDSDEKAANTMNQSIEMMLDGYEEQYYWVHRRFKTRPEGEAKIYPPRPRKRSKRRD